MKVSRLIEILKQCDQELEIWSHSNNHTADEDIKVLIVSDGGQDSYVIIGNPEDARLHDNGLRIQKRYK